MPEYLTYLESFLTISDIDEYEKLAKNYIDSWGEKRDDSADLGTAYHDYRETVAVKRGYSINHFDGKPYRTIPKNNISYDNETSFTCFKDAKSGAYLELLVSYDFPKPVFYPKFNCWIGGIAGQSDKVFINKKTRSITIADYKSNAKLNDWPLQYTNYGCEHYNYPFNKIAVTKQRTYKFQLTLYSYMLERLGFKPTEMYIEHRHKLIPLPYESGLAHTMIGHFFSTYD